MGNQIGRVYFSQKTKPLTALLTGKRLAVDGSMFLYKYCAVYRDSEGHLFKSNEGLVTAHIYGLVKFFTALLNAGIDLHFVFQGECAKLKKSEVTKRKKSKKEAKAQLAIALASVVKNYALIKRLRQQAFSVTSEIIDSTRLFLNLSGIPYHFAQYDGQKSCYALVQDGICDLVMTDDWDACFYGGRVVRNVAVVETGDAGSKLVGNYIDIANTADQLGFTQADLVAMACIAGCDYAAGLPGYGPKKAAKMITEDSFYQNSYYLESVMPVLTFVKSKAMQVSAWPLAHTTQLYDWLTLKIGIAPTLAYAFCKVLRERANRLQK